MTGQPNDFYGSCEDFNETGEFLHSAYGKFDSVNIKKAHFDKYVFQEADLPVMSRSHVQELIFRVVSVKKPEIRDELLQIISQMKDVKTLGIKYRGDPHLPPNLFKLDSIYRVLNPRGVSQNLAIFIFDIKGTCEQAYFNKLCKSVSNMPVLETLRLAVHSQGEKLRNVYKFFDSRSLTHIKFGYRGIITKEAFCLSRMLRKHAKNPIRNIEEVFIIADLDKAEMKHVFQAVDKMPSINRTECRPVDQPSKLNAFEKQYIYDTFDFIKRS